MATLSDRISAVKSRIIDNYTKYILLADEKYAELLAESKLKDETIATLKAEIEAAGLAIENFTLPDLSSPVETPVSTTPAADAIIADADAAAPDNTAAVADALANTVGQEAPTPEAAVTEALEMIAEVAEVEAAVEVPDSSIEMAA